LLAFVLAGFAVGALGSYLIARQEGAPVDWPGVWLLARALAAAKAALRASLRGDPDEGLRFERDVFCELFATKDAAEGIRAFLEKREPRFEGR
jgi:enoyl-CoA hydratase/carnithine racemase